MAVIILHWLFVVRVMGGYRYHFGTITALHLPRLLLKLVQLSECIDGAVTAIMNCITGQLSSVSGRKCAIL